MDSLTINHLANTNKTIRPHFHGVLPADKVKFIPYNKGIIANTDPSHKSGQHWVVFYNRQGTHIFFDPFGGYPYQYPSFKNNPYIQKPTWFSTHFQPQPAHAKYCGELCLYFIYLMALLPYTSYENIVKDFLCSPNLELQLHSFIYEQLL